jgi:A/G-specific adenine glycosylase
VFTHFPLELTVLFARVGAEMPAPEGMRWTPRPDLGAEPLPKLMKKVLEHAVGPPKAAAERRAIKKTPRRVRAAPT